MIGRESDILVRLRLKAEEAAKDTKDFFAGIGDEAERAGEDAGERMASGFTAKHAAFAAAGAAAFTVLVKAVNDSVQLGAEIAATSRQIGIGTEALQQFQYVAEQTGVAQNDLESSLQTLTQAIGEAANGNKNLSDGFDELGISLTDSEGRARLTDQVFHDLIATLSAIEDPSERARIGAQLLGEQYQELEPIIAKGSVGVTELTDRLDEMNGVLSNEEIQNLQETNAKFNEMQRILSINIAGAVADNAEGIIYLANSLGNLASMALHAGSAWADFMLRIESYKNSANIALAWNDPDRQIELNNRNQEIAEQRFRIQTGGVRRTTPNFTSSSSRPSFGRNVSRGGSSGRGGGSSRRTGKSAEQREQERAAKALEREYERLEGSLDRQVETLQDAAKIEDIRREKGEFAAELAKKRLDIERKYPTLIGQSAEQVAARYKITVEEGHQLLKNVELTKQLAEQASIDKWFDIQDSNFEESIAEAEEQIIEAQKRAAEEQRRIQEDQLRDISDFYYDLFSGNTGNIWKDFKRQGLSVISDIAAQWTLALLSGNKASFGEIAGGVLNQPFPGGGSPLGSLFGAVFGSGKPSAANDNTPVGIAGAVPRWYEKGIVAGEHQVPDSVAAGGLKLSSGASNALGGLGIGLGVSSLAGALGLGSSSIGGALGGAGGSALGGSIAALGSFGGPIGAVVGGLLGSVVGGLLKSTKRGSAIISNGSDGLDVTGFYGNSSSRKDASAGLAGSALDGISRIAEALGGDVNASRGLVSIGIRNGSLRVDPQGRGYTKTSKFRDIRDFGEDEEAAIRFAISDLLSDGVIGGISDASQRILQSGQDLETAIEKAAMIEELPRLLEQRLDPLGFKLDQIYDKFERLADVLREGGASAEQIADAQQLWELEKADAIESIGAASQQLKDFLLSLNAGSGSPLSLRLQQEEAEEALAPYIAQIKDAEAKRAEVERLRGSGASAEELERAETAARIASQKIDQSGFQESGSLLLGISRQINASGGSFFSQFDRIRDLTNSAISLIDNAVPMQTDRQDPFTEATANILGDHTDLLNSINDNLAKVLSGGGSSRDFNFNNLNFASQ